MGERFHAVSIMVVLAACLFGMVWFFGRSSVEVPGRTDLTDAAAHVRYLRDTRGQCFAAVKGATSPWFSTLSVTWVPCSAEVLRAVEEDAKK